MADLRVILKRSPFILLFYLALTTTIGGGAAESHEYPTTNSAERSGGGVKKLDEINDQVLKIVNKSVNSSQTNDKGRTEEIIYYDNDENSTENIGKSDEKGGNISSLMQLSHANMRGNFRRRRGIEDLVNVVDFLTNHTSDTGQFSAAESAIDSSFDEGHIDGANDQNTNAGELAFGDYNNNKDFEEDYVDTHKDPDRDDPVNTADTPSDDPINENEFSFNYPDDYYWEPAINADNSEVSPGIEPLITAIEEPSWDEKMTNDTYLQGKPQTANGLSQPANGLSQSATGLSQPATGLSQPANGLSQPANGLSQSATGLSQPATGLSQSAIGLSQPATGLPQSANGFPSKEGNFEDSQQFPEDNPLKGSEWMVKDVRGVLVEDGRGLDRLLDQGSGPVQALQRPTSQVPTLSSEAQQGCQVITTAPPVDECGNDEQPQEPGVHLVSLRWREVGIYFTITAFVILAGFGKLVFHKMHWLSSRVPESCLLIVLGVLMGLVVHFAGGTDSSDKCKSAVSFPTFSSQVFFMVLLPPIILEAAYSLHDRCFIDNLGTVLVFAVLGTLMNVFLVGFSLWGLAVVGGMGEITISLTESLVFASLISAVDPVAVLSIFQELGVNKGLYFLVFGESLLNDGVTVVVYNMFSTYMEMPIIQAGDYVLSVVVFFVVVIGGTLIGLVFGVITAVFTKYTDTVRVVEPLALLGLAYLAYITAEIFHFSGIISLIVTGLVQAQYAYPNISQKSYTTVKYFIKMASATSDTIIFMFLGMVLVHDRHVWQTGFVLWTLVLCLVIRLLVTLILAVVTNRHRLHPIGFAEQLILAYGGLRGAVAFSLVSMMPGTFEHKELFITATLVVIIFTVFVQGITVGPMVSFLNVALSSTGPRQLLEEVNVKVVDTMMAGIEEVIGRVGDNKVRESLKSFNDKYFMKWLTIPSNEDRLTKLFEKIAITEHYANLYGPSILIEKAKEELTASRQDLALGLSPYGSHFSVANFAEPEPEMPVRSSLGASLRVLGGSLRRHSSRKSSMAVSVADSRASDRSYTREEDAKILLKAMKNNAFNKLHYTYNKNLVDEENQDMTSHMNWRREHAERLALLAQLASNRPESPAGEGNHYGDGQGGGVDLPHPYQVELLTRDSAADIAEGVSLLADTRNLDAIMNYHRRHNSKKRSLRRSLGADSTHETSTDPNPNSNASSNFNPNPNPNSNSNLNPNSKLHPNPNPNPNPNSNPNSNPKPNPNPNSNLNPNPNSNHNSNPSDTVLNIKEDASLNPQTDHKST